MRVYQQGQGSEEGLVDKVGRARKKGNNVGMVEVPNGMAWPCL